MSDASTPRPIRVLINGLHAKSGGGVTYLRNMVPELGGDAGLEVTLLLHEGQRDLFVGLEAHCRIHWVSFRDGFLRRLAWEQVGLPLLARRLGVEVTFSPANFGPLFAPRPVILLRNALAVAEEDRRPGKRLYWAVLSVMTWLSLAFSRRALAVSAYARDAMAGNWAGRVEVVHHGVSPLFHPPAAGEGRDDFLLTVGDIYVQKNLLRLIEALARVREVHPRIRLKVAGRPVDAAYAALVRDEITARGLAESVELLGPVPPDALAELYRRCALFVFPSTVETFGNPLVEAMASAAPVASSNAAAMPEIAGDAAIYFDPRDSAGIADAILRVLADEALRRSLGARSLVRGSEYSWTRAGRRLADVLRACGTRAG